jgi:hypothetical protein
MKIAAACLLVVALGVIAGCQQRARPTPSIYQQAQRISATGNYRHGPSGMEFPTTVGEFKRGLLVQYDRAGRSVGARYDIEGATSRIEATIYVFPTAGGDRRVDLCGRQLEAASSDVVREHRGAARTGIEEVTFDQDGVTHRGQRATFAYDEPLPGSATHETRPSVAFLYLFCRAAESWQVEYRFSHPSELNAGPLIDDFMKHLPWTLHAS